LLHSWMRAMFSFGEHTSPNILSSKGKKQACTLKR
jgi:hypothetical protein